MEEKKNVKALLSLIFGIVGCVLAFCCGSGLPFGIAALILGILAKKDDSENTQAKVGFILGIVSIALCAASVIISTTTSIGSSLMQYINH